MQTPVRKTSWGLAIVGVIIIVMILAMLRLGVWQLDRASEKQVVLNQRIERSQQPPASMTEVFDSGSADQRFMPLQVSGKYLVDQTIYIDNQVFDKQVGYHIVTPLRLSDSSPLLLVARGWVAAGRDRQLLPEIATPENLVTLQGRLNKVFAKPPLWDADYPVSDGARWQYLELEQLESQLGHEIYPLMLELAPDFDGDSNLQRRWNQVNDDWVAKHKGYAFQWFSMAAALSLFLLFYCVRLIKPKPSQKQNNE